MLDFIRGIAESYMKQNISDSDWLSRSIYEHPSLEDYYIGLSPFIILALIVSLLLTMLNISIFCTTVTKLRVDLNEFLRRPSILLCSLYPLISVAALMTLLLPKLWLISHTIMHLSFTFGAVIFRNLCFRYVESEANYVKETDGRPISIRTPPCCCCCTRCLPMIPPNRLRLSILRYMVWQMPCVQGGIMLTLNVIYYRLPELYTNVLIYFIPFIICSILIGIWSLNITVRMVALLRTDYGLMKKMFCLQLILLLCKLQYMILDTQLNGLVLGGSYPMNHTIYKQTIINLLILVEMLLVSTLVQNAYSVPVCPNAMSRNSRHPTTSPTNVKL